MGLVAGAVAEMVDVCVNIVTLGFVSDILVV